MRNQQLMVNAAPSLNTKTKAIRRTPGSPSAGPKRMGGISTGNQAGFLDLPAELRNDIYKRIIVEKNKVIKFAPAENFSHHAALLRTCKTVYQEARQFLYGEHEFHFKRCGDVRGHFWDAEVCCCFSQLLVMTDADTACSPKRLAGPTFVDSYSQSVHTTLPNSVKSVSRWQTHHRQRRRTCLIRSSQVMTICWRPSRCSLNMVRLGRSH